VHSRNLLLRSLGSNIEHLKPYLSPSSFKSGQVLKHAGDSVESVYFPTDGLTSTRAVLQSGHEIECALIGRTNALGTVAVLELMHIPQRFVCLTDGHAWKIAASHLMSVIRDVPAIDRLFKLFFFMEMGYAVHVGICNAMHSAEQRLARWLTTAAELLEGAEVRLPQEELASGLGLQRGVVNHVLQRLKSDGLVDMARGRILIRDAEGLSRRACECRVTLRRALCLNDLQPGAEVPGPPWGAFFKSR
jgi:CRP-like cAMP-binding protein